MASSLLRGAGALAAALLPLCLPPCEALVQGAGDEGQFVDGCSGTMASALAAVRDPGMKRTGDLLMSVASAGCMLLPPPTGLVVGGALVVAGGLCEAFGSGKPHASLEDSIHLIGRGFEQVNLKLDELRVGVNHLTQMMEQVQRDVGTLYEDVHLGIQKLKKIDGVYMELMNQIYAARSDPRLAPGAKSYAEDEAKHLADRVFSVFDPGNIEEYLQRLLSDTERAGGPPDVSIAALGFQHVLSSRMKLFTLQFSASIWQTNGNNLLAQGYAEELHRQVLGYNKVVERLGLPVNRTANFLQSSHYRCMVAADAGPALSANDANCCCGLRCPGELTCSCAERAPPGETSAEACGVSTTTTTTTTCATDTGGCRPFNRCPAWQGSAHCEGAWFGFGGHCVCNPGFCAVDGACTTASCETDTGGTCHVLPCDGSRGAVECKWPRCMCSDGYCAVNGACVRPRGGLGLAEGAEPEGWRRGASPALPVVLAAAATLAAAAAAAAAVAVRRARAGSGHEPLLTGNSE